MEEPWYRQYFWLLVFGGIIFATAIMSFAILCFCRSQFSRSLTRRVRRMTKQKKETQDQNIAVITDIYPSTAPPTIVLPQSQDHHFDSHYNGYKNYIDLQVPKSKRYSHASYDSVGHLTSFDYINADTENYTKDQEYIEVLADDDGYDDVEII